MSDAGRVIRGPWGRSGEATPEASDTRNASDAAAPESAPFTQLGDRTRMALGFVVRECAVALRHSPTPPELAHWANHQQDERGEFCLFGRAISAEEARLILAHPAREVTIRAERLTRRRRA